MPRAKKFLEMDCLTAARQRLLHIYDLFDSVAVMFSGGKDSLSCVHLAKEVHDEFDLGPVNVIFRDEEVINQSVLDFVDGYRHLDWVNMYWYALPNANSRFILGRKLRYIEWDPEREWVRPMPEWAINAKDLGIEGSTSQHSLDDLMAQPFKGKVAFVTGVRAAESLIRFRSVTQKLNENYIGAIEGNAKSRVKLCKPIYDWSQQDCLKYLYDLGVPWCLAGETRFITREGPRSLADACGETVEVATSKTKNANNPRGGYWTKAEIKSFGEQQLWRVSLTRDQRTREVYATADHRWLVTRPGRVMYEVAPTTDLQPGSRLAWSQIAAHHKKCVPSPVGVAAGFVFGDGHKNPHSRGSEAHLWGAKDAALKPYFSLCGMWESVSASGMTVTKVTGMPGYFKDPPPVDESIAYLYGWLSGYFAADGDVNKQGSAHITSAVRANLELVKFLCSRLGVGTFEIIQRDRVVDGKPHTVWTMSFDGLDLTPEFFVIPEHRLRYTRKPGVRSRRGWKVVTVEPTDRVEKVYCAVVPETERFLLEDDILTMNCSVYDAQEMARVGLRVSTPLHAVSAKKFDTLRAVEPDFYEAVIRVFPEMLVQERYWKEFDQKQLIVDYLEEDPDSFEGVYRYIADHFESPISRAKALERVELWRGRRERDPENYPVQLLLETVAFGSTKRRLAGVYTQSKGEIAKRKRQEAADG